MKKNLLSLTLAVFALCALTACGGGSDEPAAVSNQGGGEVVVVEQESTDGNQENSGPENSGPENREPRGGNGFDSQYLSTDYDGAASPNVQLILGTLQLEETAEAVTTEQATKLLPFWIALQNDAITNQAERNAVLKQIESSMGASQMQAIAAMNITNQRIGEWAEANGVELPQGRGPGGPGGPGGAGGPLADMTEEERAAFREEMQSLSPEERQARFAELGIEGRPGGGPDGGQGGRQGGGQGGGQGAQGGGQGGRGFAGGRVSVLMEPLIKLLTERSSS